jgi:hypothetical protein
MRYFLGDRMPRSIGRGSELRLTRTSRYGLSIARLTNKRDRLDIQMGEHLDGISE